MAKWLSSLFDIVSNQLVLEEETAPDGRSTDIIALVDKARRDWLTARVYFDNVTDPDLIDHAIFWIEAAEKKYIYLLKQAKLLGIQFDMSVNEQQLLSDPPKVNHHVR